MTDWHGTKGMWVDIVLDPCCDFQRLPHPWPWLWIFKVKVWKCCISRMGWLIDLERKGCESLERWTHGDFQRSPQPWPWPWIFMVKFFNSNRYECEGSSTSNERDMSWQGVVPTMWPSGITLTLDFQGQILKMLYLRNRRAPWHGTKGMRVDRMLHLHCHFKLWPQPWPWPWIFMVKYWNCCISGMGGSTHLEWKGWELDMMLDAQWYWPWAVVHGK